MGRTFAGCGPSSYTPCAGSSSMCRAANSSPSGRSGSGKTTLLNLVGGLDAETGLAVMELLRAVVRSEQATALVATHDAALLDLADRVPELSDGEIVEH